ncbi:hypothetical protein M2102_001377 [Fusobacterium sp. PH5-7]|uniref:hypothetical protein n=1 Tax=Fusobacterium sp. PH5-7 TaxID=2940528 RepID=UPI00247722AA|nr:hypothetical protein [Fusobacterium sp. PH5-7]MDH6457748.1 hypothetical protein [Fusobacterium sp. PH5-7]
MEILLNGLDSLAYLYMWIVPFCTLILILFIYRILKGEPILRDDEAYLKHIEELKKEKTEQEKSKLKQIKSEEKRKRLFILGIIILILSIIFTKDYRAERVLQKHLKARYGEEFVIFGMGERAGNVRRWYEAAVVYPKSYIGTRKENDSYYWGKGFVELNNGMKGGDTYGKVLLNESANEFYGKKLKELFGENYLAVINVKGPYSNRDFEKEMESRRISLEKELGGIPPEIAGGIYIFGRVENDKDREWYRKQIYEFIQFMKETGTFEYVDLDIIIVDERALISNPKKLLENFPKNLSENEKKRKKREMMKAGDKEFADMTQKEILNKINSINKAEYRKQFFGGLLYVKVYSQKYIKSRNFNDEEIKEYNKVEDIKFDWELW